MVRLSSRVAAALAVSVLAASGFGCADRVRYNWAAERAIGYRVGPGDVLRVNVWKRDELSQPALVVRPDGAITLPLVGEVPAAGRSVDELATELQQRLEKFYQERPPVTVQVVEVRSYKVYVMGEVARPGELGPNHPVTVLQAVAMAGGFTRFATPSHVVIVRRDARGERSIPFDYDALLKEGQLQQNLVLQTGDTVVVP
jgi:polysaccharide export outer membrane protein